VFLLSIHAQFNQSDPVCLCTGETGDQMWFPTGFVGQLCFDNENVTPTILNCKCFYQNFTKNLLTAKIFSLIVNVSYRDFMRIFVGFQALQNKFGYLVFSQKE
jgi:hypothetical protein